MNRFKTRDEIVEYLLEDKLNSEQIARIVGCSSGYVRAVKQRYITAPDREKLRAEQRCDSDEYRKDQRRRQRKRMRNPAIRAIVTIQKREWRRHKVKTDPDYVLKERLRKRRRREELRA